MTAPKPTPFSAVNAIQDALWKARTSESRARLRTMLARVKRLYGLPSAPDTARDLDMKRRETFVAARHPLIKSKKVVVDDYV